LCIYIAMNIFWRLCCKYILRWHWLTIVVIEFVFFRWHWSLPDYQQVTIIYGFKRLHYMVSKDFTKSFEFEMRKSQDLEVIIFISVRFLLKKNQTETSSNQFGSVFLVWLGFFRFGSFFLVWLGFFGLDSVRFFWFQAYKTEIEPNRSVFSKF